LIGGVPMVAVLLSYKGLQGVWLVFVLHHLAVSEIGANLNLSISSFACYPYQYFSKQFIHFLVAIVFLVL